MTFSYSGDPQTSQKDGIRYLVGDTDSTEPLVSDEEIEFMLNTWYPLYGTLEYVGAEVLDALAAKYAREANYSADGVSVSLASLQQQLTNQAMKLREMHNRQFVGAEPDVGGMDEWPDLEALGIKPYAFGTGFMDNQYAGQQDYGGRETGTPSYVPEYQPGG
jgi:hypothetical protein